MATEYREDTKRALVTHQPDGESYIVEYCSVWDGDEPAGTRILTAAGPISPDDLQPGGGLLEGSRELFDRIDTWEGLTDEHADWLQACDEAGELEYPIGAR